MRYSCEAEFGAVEVWTVAFSLGLLCWLLGLAVESAVIGSMLKLGQASGIAQV